LVIQLGALGHATIVTGSGKITERISEQCVLEKNIDRDRKGAQ
jgi:hypothetical protein